MCTCVYVYMCAYVCVEIRLTYWNPFTRGYTKVGRNLGLDVDPNLGVGVWVRFDVSWLVSSRGCGERETP